MGKRQRLPFQCRGLHRGGDPLNAPSGSCTKAKNLFLRPGARVDKRPGWLRESAIQGVPGGFFKFVDESGGVDVLGYVSNASGQNSAYRTSAGAWTSLGSTLRSSTSPSWVDYTNIFGKAWLAGKLNDSGSNIQFSFDGSTLTQDPFGHKVAGATICSFIRRIFIGDIRWPGVANLLTGEIPVATEDATKWTVTGGMSVANSSGLRTATISNGSTDVLALASAVTTGSAGYVIYQQHLRATSATTNLPLTLKITDSATTTEYAAREITLLNKTSEPDWIQVTIEARVPAGTAVKVLIKAGTASTAAPIGSTFEVSDSNYDNAARTYRGAILANGRFAYDRIININPMVAASTRDQDRIYWCETDQPTYWRSNNWYDCKEVAGPITALRVCNGRMFAFKQNATWSFNPTEDPDNPLQFVDMHAFGTYGPHSIRVLDNYMYFIGENEVYEWSGSGDPRPLAGEPMRETLFPASGIVAKPLLEVDQEKREVWVYTVAGNLYVYSLERQEWTGPITLTGASDSQLNVGDLIYIKPTGESAREIWAIESDSGNIVKLRSSQTQDNITGTARDIVAEYEIRCIADVPYQDITLEQVVFNHAATASQSASTTTAAVSTNGGVTYSKTNTVRISPLSDGGFDYRPLRIPVWQTSPRITLKLTHTGLGGKEYFSVTGGYLEAQTRGADVPKNTPTQVSSSL